MEVWVGRWAGNFFKKKDLEGTPERLPQKRRDRSHEVCFSLNRVFLYLLYFSFSFFAKNEETRLPEVHGAWLCLCGSLQTDCFLDDSRRLNTRWARKGRP